MFFLASTIAIILLAIFSILSFLGAIPTKNHSILLAVILLAFDNIALVLSSIFVFRLAFRQIVSNALLFVLVSLFWIFAVHFAFHFLSPVIDDAFNIKTIKGIIKLPPIVFLVQVIGVYWFAKTKLIQGDLSRANLTSADDVVMKQDVSEYNEVVNNISHVKEYNENE